MEGRPGGRQGGGWRLGGVVHEKTKIMTRTNGCETTVFRILISCLSDLAQPFQGGLL